MTENEKETRKFGGLSATISRRQFTRSIIRAFAFSSLPMGGHRLLIHPRTGLQEQVLQNSRTSEALTELGRSLLFRTAHAINGITSTGFRSVQKEVHHRDAIKHLIEGC